MDDKDDKDEEVLEPDEILTYADYLTRKHIVASSIVLGRRKDSTIILPPIYNS